MAFSELFTDVITKLETIPKDWISGCSYVQGINIVAVFGVNGVTNGYYTCKTSNQDQVFTPSKWIYSLTLPTLPSPPANNYQKTPSTTNQLLSFINIFNEQIDNEIKEKGYIIKCPACFIEFLPEEPKQILGGFTQYPDAKMYFHIYSDQLNSPNIFGFGKYSGDFMDADIFIYTLRDRVKSAMLTFHTHMSSAMMARYDALDYKHKQITKYILGFNFVYTDYTGSINDPRSSRYIQAKPFPANLNQTRINQWISGEFYILDVSVVNLAVAIVASIAGYYLCLVSNMDTTFTPANWQLLTLWVGSISYAVGAYIYLGIFCYVCTIANSDVTFNVSNWQIICRI